MTNKSKNYLDLLEIRQKGRRRDAAILGSVFWLTFIALVFLLITGQLTGRAIVIVSAIEVVFGVSWLMAWVRLEEVRNTIELIRSTME